MRRLLLFRHAKAERAEPGERDFERVLTEQGRKDAARIGAYMVGHSLVPDRVAVSPAARTLETWKFAGGAFRPRPAVTLVDRLYDATPYILLSLVKDIGDTAHSLLLIGHNPGLHELAQMLIASGDIETRERLREELPAAGLIIVDFAFDDWGKLHTRSGRLERLISPKTLQEASH